jgi:hypothetical protein
MSGHLGRVLPRVRRIADGTNASHASTLLPRLLASAAIATSRCMTSASPLRAAILTTRLHDPYTDGASVAATIERMPGLGKRVPWTGSKNLQTEQSRKGRSAGRSGSLEP